MNKDEIPSALLSILSEGDLRVRRLDVDSLNGFVIEIRFKRRSDGQLFESSSFYPDHERRPFWLARFCEQVIKVEDKAIDG